MKLNYLLKLTILYSFMIFLNHSIIAQNAKVQLGIEVLAKSNFEILKGKKVGLITNASGVDSHLNSTIDILNSAKGFELVALFGPEHGIRGDVEGGDNISDYTDKTTGLPVYSLYGKNRKPPTDILDKIDILIYDIQDIGCRSYTFISSLGKVMEAAAENNKQVIVLDRPNPLGGNKVEGSIVEEGFFSFISQFPIPYVYGLTVGELANMINNEGMLENKLKCSLIVVKMEGWKRNFSFEDTGLNWVPTSPHVPHKDSPAFYVMSGIVGELRDVISIGVGYTLPFQTFAYKGVDGIELANRLNNLNLSGIIFMPISYKPYYAFAKGEQISGVETFITDFDKIELMKTQLYVLQELNLMYPNFKILDKSAANHLRAFDKAMGTDKVRIDFSKNYSVADVEKYLDKDIEAFKLLSKKYYLYE
ncbi:MAG: hypothetical protein COW71_11585 [Ignavibacteriales bacterium CG18_big_fil_WC_8_21_14_2_50_31_20]|nr:MAG: hypothetical protein COW71_11585 [Ignavibacteriales bacterium CG18_big_fil_WC_8_21_14_2_50_31_20]